MGSFPGPVGVWGLRAIIGFLCATYRSLSRTRLRFGNTGFGGRRGSMGGGVGRRRVGRSRGRVDEGRAPYAGPHGSDAEDLPWLPQPLRSHLSRAPAVSERRAAAGDAGPPVAFNFQGACSVSWSPTSPGVYSVGSPPGGYSC